MSWPLVKLGDIGEFRAGFGFPEIFQGRNSGDYPFAKVGDVSAVARSGQKYISTANHFVDESDLNTLKAKPLPLGSIVFAKIGEAIRQNFRAVTSAEMLIDNNTMGLVPNLKLVSVDYLYHFMCQLDLYKLSGATTVPSIRKSTLEEIPFPLPPLEEQKRIAAILDKADAIRRKRQQAIKLADDFLRSVFLEMFGDPVTNPKGWEQVILKDIADIRSGVTKGKAVKSESAVTLPYMRVANVQDGYLNLSDIQEITVSRSDANKCKLQYGDILLTEGGDPDKLGRGHVWKNEIENCIHQNHIFSVRVGTNLIRPEFLSALIASQRGKRYFLKVGKQTTGIATINKTVLSEFEPFVPPIELQDKYLKLVEKVNSIKDRVSSDQDFLFKSVSQKAFSGKL